MPAERSVGIKDYFEFRNIVRNTTTAGADDVLTKFIGMCKILFVQGRDIRSRQRPLLLLDLQVCELSV